MEKIIYKNLRVAHIGYLVYQLDKAIKQFEALGFMLCSSCNDQARGINIALIKNSENICIELIQPTNKNNPVSSILKKIGPTPYHLCFSANKSSEETTKFLLEKGFTLMVNYSEAPALGENKYVTFYYSAVIGIVEIVFTEGGPNE